MTSIKWAICYIVLLAIMLSLLTFIPIGRSFMPFIFSIFLILLFLRPVEGALGLLLVLFFGFMLRIYHMLSGGIVFGNDALRDHLNTYFLLRIGVSSNFYGPHYYRVFPAIPLLSGILAMLSKTPLEFSHYFLLMGIEVISSIPLYLVGKYMISPKAGYIASLVYLSIPRLVQWGFMPIPQTLALSLFIFGFLLLYRGLFVPLALSHFAVTYIHTPTAMASLILLPSFALTKGVKRCITVGLFLLIISVSYWYSTSLLQLEVIPAINVVLHIISSPSLEPTIKISPMPTQKISPPSSSYRKVAVPRLIKFKPPPDFGELAFITWSAWRIFLSLGVTLFVLIRRYLKFLTIVLLGFSLVSLTALGVNYRGVSGSRSLERYLATPAYVIFSLSSAAVSGGYSFLFLVPYSILISLDPHVSYSLNPAGFRHYLSFSEKRAVDVLLDFYEGEVVADYDLGTAYIWYKATLSGRELIIKDFRRSKVAGLGYIRLYVLRNWYLYNLNPGIIKWIHINMSLIYNNYDTIFTLPLGF